MEIHAPHTYDALAEMTKTYSAMIRSHDSENWTDITATMRVAKARYENFRAAAYAVFSLVPGTVVQQQISELLEIIQKHEHLIHQEDDTRFLALLSSINDYMLSSKVQNTRKRKKQ